MLVLGAVAYSPKVVTIWEGFKEYFGSQGLSFDYVLYSNYERQVESLFNESIDIAWNSPLAWIRAERLGRAKGKPVSALLMRDTDQDLHSVFLVHKKSNYTNLKQLAGKKVGFGAIDSPQATLLPLEMFREAELFAGKDFEFQRFDILTGKHGDHIGGEQAAVESLLAGKLDAACILASNFSAFCQQGIIDPDEIEILTRTPLFDHCNFTVGCHASKKAVEQFRAILLDMSYDDPTVRHLFDLEGLTCWKEGRTSGYQALCSAVDAFHFYGKEGEILEKEYRY